MLLSLQKGPCKLFGEYLLSDHEGDLERLQLGWQLSDETVLWIGRFHQPTSVWNHDHHHGQYLQTSITRPAIDEWEDLGGVIPQHFTGALLESGRTVFGWKLRTAVAAGIAPQITAEGLEPFDLLKPDSHRHQMGYQARASVHPGDFTDGRGHRRGQRRTHRGRPDLAPASGLRPCRFETGRIVRDLLPLATGK